MRKQFIFNTWQCKCTLQSLFFTLDWKAVCHMLWISSYIKNGRAAAKLRADLELPVMRATTKELQSVSDPAFLKIKEEVNTPAVGSYTVYTQTDR